MPRIRKSETVSTKEPITKAKKSKKIVKKTAVVKKNVSVAKIEQEQKIIPAKKAKPVIVDVIEDEEEDVVNSENFFSDESLSNHQTSPLNLSEDVMGLKKTAQKNELEDLEIDVNAEEGADINSEHDIQKRFFSDLVSEIKTKRINEQEDGQDDAITAANLEHKTVPANYKSVGLYRRLVWKFLIMVGFLAALVFYLFFSKLTIFITPQVEAMSDTLFLRVGGDENTEILESDPREKVSGSINEFEVEVENIYQATGEKSSEEELQAEVTIFNNYIKDQPLIATTRLLSSDGKLFRLKEAVNIPAGGKVTAEVYADKDSSDMAIKPSHFTIPGLWAGLQDKIYAESDQAFTYDEKTEKYILASDISSAVTDIKDLLMAKAGEQKDTNTQEETLYEISDTIETEVNATVGDKVSEFKVSAKAKVMAVTFSKEEAAKLASAKLNILVPDDKELSEFKTDSLSYALENYDSDKKTATVKASFAGLMILKNDSSIIDKERLVNLNAEQIDAYLSDYPEIGHYELNFSPSFVKRAPRLVDRIEIKIK